MPIGAALAGLLRNPGWTPADLPSLVGWYDAYNVQTSGAKVTQMDDRSGNGNHATQTTDADRPDYVSDDGNGRPYVLFQNNGTVGTGEDVEFFDLPITFSGSANRSVFAVFRQNAATNSVIVSFGQNSPGERWSFLGTDALVLRIAIQGAGYSTSLAISTTADTIAGIVLDGTQLQDHTLYDESSSESASGTDTVNTDTSTGNFIANRDGYGGGSPDDDALGRLRELVICSTNISASDITELRAYFTARWGL